MRKITITVSEKTARWAKTKAARENSSVSKMIRCLLDNEMRSNDEYWRAYDRWKRIGCIKGIDADSRLSREQAHERR